MYNIESGFVVLYQSCEDPCVSDDVHHAPHPECEEHVLAEEFELVRLAEP